MDVNEIELRRDSDGVTLLLRVTPRGRANRIEGARNGALRLSVTAPPEDSKANAAALEILAAALRIAKSSLCIVRGHTSRDKTVRVAFLNEDEIRARLSLLCPSK